VQADAHYMAVRYQSSTAHRVEEIHLAFYRDLLVGTRERVAALKKQGKSLNEIVAAKPTAATDATWGNGFRSPKDFIGDVFQGV
jgi:hypothetical protein